MKKRKEKNFLKKEEKKSKKKSKKYQKTKKKTKKGKTWEKWSGSYVIFVSFAWEDLQTWHA